MIPSVYIHIPFCHHICHYCDFTKFFYNERMADDYLAALKNEIATAVSDSKNRVKTIFIGGGHTICTDRWAAAKTDGNHSF
ncbi:hypothetical protein RWE15_23590 [Virgibacillus halophilus]|uniref:Radical SAM core domain-containing protein n=1 Tax=Tigheibacillus halophilus TaxID=361280 RepID=A0ABU5CBR3_9BACI|nr:hypothetical protein [Virgibacillus halophilus]